VILCLFYFFFFFFFSSRRRHTRLQGDWSSDVCSSDLSTVRASSSVVSRPGNSAMPLRSSSRVRAICCWPRHSSPVVMSVGGWSQIGRASCRERVEVSGGGVG